MNNTLLLGLSSHWVEELQELFKAHAPTFEVWAYGSRVTGNYHEGSDLDLVLIHPHHPETKRCETWFELREALSESNIPICVDVMDWASVPKEFHSQINKQKILLFSANE